VINIKQYCESDFYRFNIVLYYINYQTSNFLTHEDKEARRRNNIITSTPNWWKN